MFAQASTNSRCAHSKRRLAVLALGFALAMQGRRADAQADSGFRLGVHLGGASSEVSTGSTITGAQVGLSAFGHYSFIQLGVVVDYLPRMKLVDLGLSSEAQRERSCTGLLGALGARFVTPLERGTLRYDLLFVAGTHRYENVAIDLSGASGGLYPRRYESPSLAFVGGRAGIAYEWAGAPHFALGVQGMWEVDVEYLEVTDQFGLSQRIAGDRIGAVLTLELALDFTRRR